MRDALRALVSLAVGSALLLVVASPARPAAVSPASLRPVQDPANRFLIDVPAAWNVKTSAKDPAVAAEAPAPAGALPDSVDVIVRDLAAPISPAGCVEQAQVVMRYAIHSWTTVDKGPTTLAGWPAYYHMYTWRTSKGEDRRSLQTCVTAGRRVFVIVATTGNTPVKVQQDLPELKRITATFRPIASSLLPAAVPEQPGTRQSGR